jgi:hypothetical protein
MSTCGKARSVSATIALTDFSLDTSIATANASPSSVDFFSYAATICVVQLGDDDIGALLCQPLRHGAADSLARPCDDGTFSFKHFH